MESDGKKKRKKNDDFFSVHEFSLKFYELQMKLTQKSGLVQK
jgi:hypothetical protein